MAGCQTEQPAPKPVGDEVLGSCPTLATYRLVSWAMDHDAAAGHFLEFDQLQMVADVARIVDGVVVAGHLPGRAMLAGEPGAAGMRCVRWGRVLLIPHPGWTPAATKHRKAAGRNVQLQGASAKWVWSPMRQSSWVARNGLRAQLRSAGNTGWRRRLPVILASIF